MAIPIIDLFAGPGGMGEGFSSLPHDRFRLSVSIEKDAQAHQTLRMRSAFRELQRMEVGKEVWKDWYATLQNVDWHGVFEALSSSSHDEIRKACRFAGHEAWNLEMAADNRTEVINGIRERLSIAGFDQSPEHCVVIGGPPCQAYSLVGRARNKGKSGYKAEEDHRHFLYREYLNVLKEFRPVVFVMENVKGILTSKVDGAGIFEAVRADLRNPGKALGGQPCRFGYRLLALSTDGLLQDDPTASDFIIRAEDHGVPQMRHRVIVLGIREDLELPPLEDMNLGRHKEQLSVQEAIGDLPAVRSDLSARSKDMTWQEALSGEFAHEVVQQMLHDESPLMKSLGRQMKQVGVKARELARNPVGSDRYHQPLAAPDRGTRAARKFHGWVKDRTQMPFVANHESRTHRADDLLRYLFAALYGKTDESPRLGDFPRALLPQHKNIDPDNPGASIFKDRFRVQVASKPATTITSHIAKDGHYFIHYDPEQCRSLTVREAARLQSFPDNYVFMGNRTSQYTQVGNAVPPLLARQFAEVVHRVLEFNGI